MDPISLLEEEKNTDFLQDFYKNKIISILDSQREINPVKDPLSVLNEERKRPSFQETKQNKKTGMLQFGLKYVATTTFLFLFLVIGTNYSAYWSLIESKIHPEILANAKADMLHAVSQNQIKVYAEEKNQEDKKTDKKDEIDTIRQQLVNDQIDISENPFATKRLIESHPKIQTNIEVVPYENRIIIPKIGRNIPLVDVHIGSNVDFNHMENIFMKELENGVIRYPGTAKPGQAGNSFIFGHSSNYPWIKGDYNDAFALLDNLSAGDEIIVFYQQKKFIYKISEKKVVKPGNVKALMRDPSKKELSLMTCWPLGTTLNRMIVFAELQN